MNLNQPIAILKKENIALDIISNALKNGCLTLFIGAGVSKATTDDFPDWYKLVARCCKELNINLDPSCENKKLRQAMEAVEGKCLASNIDYIEFLKRYLYEGVTYNLQLMKTDLLIALGSLVMGSVRGSAKSVINYNFDDLLEWYLQFHGFKTQVISELPTIIRKSDVSVYHPHGFLPLDPKFAELQSQEIILTQKSYLKSYSDLGSWNEFQVAQLSCKLGLFIGLSGEDEHIELLCQRAFERVQKRGGRSIIAYMILIDNKLNRSTEELRETRGLASLYIDTHDALPKKLLDISRTAAGLKMEG